MIIFRPAKPGEFNNILHVLKETSVSTNNISSPFNTFIVLEDNSKIIGVAGIEIYRDIGVLNSVAILPAYRGQQLGSGIVKSVLNFADRRNVKKIYLSTEKEEAFFKKLGFKTIDKQEIDERCSESTFLKNCSQKAKIMVLNLVGYFDKPCSHANT